MNKQIINISSDFSFSYGRVPLLHIGKNDDGFYFERGKIYGIFGENGSGKTTFLNLINSFIQPTCGKITYSFKNGDYENTSISKNDTHLHKLISNNIRRCFQVPYLVDELSIYENIEIAQRQYGKESFANTFSILDKNFQNKEILELLNSVDLNGNELAETLSYGQRRIVSNLQTLFSKPELIILDEPFSNIHVNVIEKLKNEYSKKVEAFNTTILIVEHTPDNLKGFANEIIILKDKNIFKQEYID